MVGWWPIPSILFKKKSADPEYRLPDGKIDLRLMGQAYREARLDMDSDLMQQCREAGHAATRSARARFAAGSRVSSTSNFGTMTAATKAKLQRSAKDSALLADYDARMMQVRSHASEEQQLSLVHCSHAASQCIRHITSAATGDIPDRLSELSNLARALVRREKASELQAKEQALKCIVDAGRWSSVDLGMIQLPESGALKFFQGALPTLHWQDSVADVAATCAQDLATHHTTLTSPLLDFFAKSSRSVMKDDAPTLAATHHSFTPTYCYKYGGGQCLCTQDTVVFGIARKNSTSALLSICPYKSVERRLLRNGHMVAVLQGNIFLHVGLMYLNPERATYLRLHPVRVCDRGQQLLECRLVDGALELLTDVEAMQLLCLDREADLSLCRIRGLYGEEHTPFIIGSRILVEPLDLSIPDARYSVHFWKGRDAELRDELARRRRQRARNVRRQGPAGHGANEQNVAQRQTRRLAQLPPSAGLLMLPSAEGASEDLQEPVRILDDGEFVGDDQGGHSASDGHDPGGLGARDAHDDVDLPEPSGDGAHGLDGEDWDAALEAREDFPGADGASAEAFRSEEGRGGRGTDPYSGGGALSFRNRDL